MSRNYPQSFGLGFTYTQPPEPAQNARPRESGPIYSDGVYANGCYYWNDGSVVCDDNRQSVPAPNPRPRNPAPSPAPLCYGCDDHRYMLPTSTDKSLAATLGLTQTQLTMLGIAGVVVLLIVLKPKKGA